MEWKESNELPAALLVAESGAVIAYVIEAVTIDRHASQWARSVLGSLGPPYSLQPSSFFSLWLASHCSPLFSFPYRSQPTQLLSNHSSLLMDLSTLSKVGAGSTAVSCLHSLYIIHNLTVTVEASAQEEVEVRLHAKSHIDLITYIFSQEGAYADVVVKLGLIKLLHKEF